MSTTIYPINVRNALDYAASFGFDMRNDRIIGYAPVAS